MTTKLKSIAKNPKVQTLALSAAGAAAGAYGGPLAANAVAVYLPKIAAFLGL